MPRELVGRVPSRRHVGVVYDVRLDEHGEYSCSCPGFGFRGTCRHAATMQALQAQPIARRRPGREEGTTR